jgi:signal transduction histidine kinase
MSDLLQAGDRVLVLAPFRRDAATLCETLAKARITCAVATSIDDLTARIREGVAAALITQEALTCDGLALLMTQLSKQPSWSDLPVVLLSTDIAAPDFKAGRLMAELRSSANVTVLVRPVPTLALITAVQAALRARIRQYEVRDLIEREYAARIEAQQANRVKDEFLAIVSHELRTPLSTMQLWMRLMTSGRVKADGMPEAIEAIHQCVESQSRLVEDLLDMSRMLNGKLRLDVVETELDIIAQDAIDMAQPLAQVKNIQLEKSIERGAGLVRADPARMQQIIWNLLGNAIKFTPSGGDVSLELRREQTEIVIRVADTGQGIAPEFMPHIFDRFRQADATSTRRNGGLGLGLAITQQLIDLHGGAITAQSDGIGKGAAFTVRLPRTQRSH